MPLSYYVYTYFYKHLLKLYLRRDATLTLNGLQLKIFKGVFHPGLFFSTRYFFEFIKTLPLKGISFLDVGCGSGVLGLLAASKGARVTAIDISAKAVENTALNFKRNISDAAPHNIIQSDLFTNVPQQPFDVIVINPPFFFKEAGIEPEYAWYCGPNGEYFESLFKDLHRYVHANSQVFMILADNCDINRIQAIALKHNVKFTLAHQKKVKWEMNYIFQLALA